MTVLHYQDMPKEIQNLVDGAEFLERVEKHKIKQPDGTLKTVYMLVYRDSCETWAKFYDGWGNSLGQTAFIPIARESQ